jgi:hypothetical protein
MKIILAITSFSFIVSVYLLSCKKSDVLAPADVCKGVSYNVDYFKTESVGGANNGSVTILYPVGDTISYQLNNSSFQASNIFSNLSPGNYVITIKNQKGCTDTAQISILNYGPRYALVRQIIYGYCGPCHLNGALNGGKNFDEDASVINSWDRIKARAVDGIPTFMPEAPNSPLTNPDKQKIVDWVNAGHRMTD